MVHWVSNIPDQEHLPYKHLATEPHPKDVVRYFRNSDYTLISTVGLGAPAAFVAMERYKPSVHPRYIPKALAVQIPSFFAIGFYMAYVRSLQRFWGATENKREYDRWIAEGKDQIVEPKNKGWQDNDW